MWPARTSRRHRLLKRKLRQRRRKKIPNLTKRYRLLTIDNLSRGQEPIAVTLGSNSKTRILRRDSPAVVGGKVAERYPPAPPHPNRPAEHVLSLSGTLNTRDARDNSNLITAVGVTAVPGRYHGDHVRDLPQKPNLPVLLAQRGHDRDRLGATALNEITNSLLQRRLPQTNRRCFPAAH